VSSIAIQTPTRAQRAPMPALGAILDGPWEVADLASLAGRVLLAAIGIFVAWEGASRSVVWNDQQAWTALGIGSLVFGLAGIVGWLRAGVVRIRDVKQEVIATIQTAPAAATRARATPTGVTLGEGMSLYHRADCIFVEGKAIRTLSPQDAERAGAAPCVVCEP
jgi:hypothetical protein